MRAESQTYAARKQREYYRRNKDVRAKKLQRHRAKYCETPTRPETAVCECCGQAQSAGRAMCLDHCHVTGRFRGWLCDKCNGGIGKLGDTIEGVLRAVDYLKRVA